MTTIQTLTDLPDALHRGYTCAVSPDWIDYNGHMNVAYYVLAFDQATDHFSATLGLGPDYLAERNCSFFVVDMNVTYRREVGVDTELTFATHLLDFTEKKMLFFHYMFSKAEGFLAATNALLSVHVDMEARRSAPFPAGVLERLSQIKQNHDAVAWPEAAGRALSL